MDEYERGFMEGREDGKAEAEERYEDHYNDGWQEGLDHAAEQHGKERDELRGLLAVREQQIDLLKERVTGLLNAERKLEEKVGLLEAERDRAWYSGYDQAILDVMENESA